MSKELIIDLSLGDHARRADNNHLFHRSVYEWLSDNIKTQLERNRNQFSKPTGDDNINQMRSHDAILLAGDRGTGKTWILINISGFVERDDELKKIANEILFLDPVDPTLLNDNEDFLNIVVGQINKSHFVKNKLETGKSEQNEAYCRRLEDLATALEGEQSTRSQVGLDRLLSYQGSLDIAQHAHCYFRGVLELTGRRLIVLPIDDVDMSLHYGFKVLEVVRKHLCSPYILPIVSGDFHLYQELVGNQFCAELVHEKRSAGDKNMQRKQAQQLAYEYLRKVFPMQQRITVPTIDRYCTRYAGASTMVANGKQVLSDLHSIHQLLLAVFNGRVNGEENSSVDYVPRTARELMQLLYALKPVLEKLPSHEFPSSADKDSKENLIKKDISVWWLKRSKLNEDKNKKDISAYEVYDILSRHFAQEPRLRELCEALKQLNRKDGIDRLDEITYLNPIRQMDLKDNLIPWRQNENYVLYSKTKKDSPASSSGKQQAENFPVFRQQFESLPLGLRESICRSLIALPAIEPIDYALKFSKAYVRKCIKGNDKNKLFFLSLFTHDDFYTSYQTAPLVFFGRFFELITMSLIRDVNAAWLQNLLMHSPYYSILSVSGAKVFDFDEETGDVSGNIAEDGSQQLKTLTQDLATDINAFRQKNPEWDNMFFADASLLAALQSKYFNQINLYKSADKKTIPTNRKTKVLNDEDFKEIALRAAYSYWGALGSFEMSDLYFGDEPNKICHQNFFAVNKQINSGNIKKYNNVYRLNIEPFLGDKDQRPFSITSFTRLLNDHPVYKRIEELIKSMEAPLPDFSPIQTNQKNQQAPYNPTDYNAISAELKEFSLIEKQDDIRASDDEDAVLRITDELYDRAFKACGQDTNRTKQAIQDLGKYLKTQSFFGGARHLDVLLALIWEVLLKKDTEAFSSPATLETRLTGAGVNETLASLLAKGIEI